MECRTCSSTSIIFHQTLLTSWVRTCSFPMLQTQDLLFLQDSQQDVLIHSSISVILSMLTQIITQHSVLLEWELEQSPILVDGSKSLAMNTIPETQFLLQHRL